MKGNHLLLENLIPRTFALILAGFFYLNVSNIVFADVLQNIGDTKSEQQWFTGRFQSLGNGLDGTLTNVDIKLVANANFYYIDVFLSLIECDTPGYSEESVSSTCSNDGEPVAQKHFSFQDGLREYDGTFNFDIDDYTLIPEKYYFLKLNANGSFGVMGNVEYYGTSTDEYLNGSFCENNPWQLVPCISDDNIKDLYFILHGVEHTIVPTTVCTENCNSNVMFLPGLEASRLYKPDYNGGTDRLWEPNNNGDAEQLFLDEDGESLGHDIYAKDVVDELPVLGENVYKSFLNDLDDWKNPDEDNLIADYSAIPYDWRLTFDDLLTYGNDIDGRVYYSGDLRSTTTPYIIQEINRLANGSRNGKVTIVAHSNGGLLAKFLLKKLEDTNDPLLSKIDKLILVAVPQTGTPEAVGALLNGFNQGHFPVISEETARVFGKNMPGAYGLLPSTAYWNGEGSGVTATPLIRFEGGGGSFTPINQAVNLYGETIDNKTELDRFLRGEEGRVTPDQDDLKAPEVLNSGLIQYGNTVHTDFDSWIPPANIEVHEIAGWGEETLSSITYKPKATSCAQMSGSLCIAYNLDWTYKPELVIDGDGTVVAPSALALSTSSPNVKRWWLNLEKYNKESFPNRVHKNITEVPQLVELIKNKISSSTTLVQFISENQPSTESTKRLYFYLYSPLDLTAIDDLGNILSSTTSAIPGARYKRFGEVQYISIPEEANPTIHLVGQTSGLFDLEIEEKQGNTIIATTTFASIPTATTTVASIEFTDGTIENAFPLEVDFEGDGEPDVFLEPEVGEIVTMPPLAPADSVAPEAIINFSTITNSIVISGTDDVTDNPTISNTATSTTISDNANNNLQITRTFKKGKNYERVVLAKLMYGTTTVMSVNTNPIAQYLWVKNPKNNKYLIFISHLRTPTEGLITIYDTLKNKTNIISISKDLTDIDLESVIKKLPKGAIIKKTVNGLVIPHLETEKGKVFIKY